MMPELDEPFGRHRWDPLADIEALAAKDATPAPSGEDVPAPTTHALLDTTA
jgi:hypothetical protein